MRFRTLLHRNFYRYVDIIVVKVDCGEKRKNERKTYQWGLGEVSIIMSSISILRKKIDLRTVCYCLYHQRSIMMDAHVSPLHENIACRCVLQFSYSTQKLNSDFDF